MGSPPLPPSIEAELAAVVHEKGFLIQPGICKATCANGKPCRTRARAGTDRCGKHRLNKKTAGYKTGYTFETWCAVNRDTLVKAYAPAAPRDIAPLLCLLRLGYTVELAEDECSTVDFGTGLVRIGNRSNGRTVLWSFGAAWALGVTQLHSEKIRTGMEFTEQQREEAAAYARIFLEG